MKFLFLSITLNLLVLTVSADSDSVEPLTTTATADTNAVVTAIVEPTSTVSPVQSSESSTAIPTGSKPRTAQKVYNSCGSNCPQTCAKPNPQVCIKSCKAGWFCPSGYFENSDSKCVVREDCGLNNGNNSTLPGSSPNKPQTASKVYRDCATTCPKTCSNPEPRFCTLVCKPGWQCPNDYYENSVGKCVLKEYCDTENNNNDSQNSGSTQPLNSYPSNDSPNKFKPRKVSKVYSSCATTCPKTCAKPDPKICSFVCRPGWVCPNGYFLNSASECVVKEDCYLDNSQQPSPFPNPGPFPGPFQNPGPIQAPGPVILPNGPRPGYQPLPIIHRPYPGFRPMPRPRPFPGDFGRFPDSPDFGPFDGYNNQVPQSISSINSIQTQPTTQITPIEYNSTSIASGDSNAPPAVVRTTGSNAPIIHLPAMITRSKPIIDFDPTVPRPRIGNEYSSDDDVQSSS